MKWMTFLVCWFFEYLQRPRSRRPEDLRGPAPNDPRGKTVRKKAKKGTEDE